MTKKKNNFNMEVTIKKISNGYTVEYYEDETYDNFITTFCADREDVLERIAELEF